MKWLKEFKEFAMRGNVLDMAVGIIIGGAFNKIVSSLVADVIMPPIGLLLGGINFNDWKIPLHKAVTGTGGVIKPEVTLNIGSFIQTVLDFTIVAFSVFLIVRFVNNLTRKRAEAPVEPPAPTTEEKLLSEIRDLLKNKNDQ